jgi:hypothetical protein
LQASAAGVDGRAPRVEAAIASSNDGSWWVSIATLYLLNSICERPDAAAVAGMTPDLNPDTLRAVCHDLAPDLAASLAACYLPDIQHHVPHTSIDIPGALAHADVVPGGAVDAHHLMAATSAIDVGAAVMAHVPDVAVNVPDVAVDVRHITVDVSVSSFDRSHSHSC